MSPNLKSADTIVELLILRLGKEIGVLFDDFFTMSNCRDLLFHVQEHRFTLPQIEAALKEIGLKFIGFEFFNDVIRNEFVKQNPGKEDIYSLPLWHEFELRYPQIFRSMYQFWLVK